MIFTKIALGALSAAVIASGITFAGDVQAQEKKPKISVNQSINEGIKDGQVGKKFKHDRRKRKDRPKLTEEQRAALKTAIEQGDYEAWKKILGDAPITQKITAENFSKFVEALKLMKAGDKDAAMKIFKELGIKPPHHLHKKHRQ